MGYLGNNPRAGYSSAEIDDKLDSLSQEGSPLDNRYYTEPEVDTEIASIDLSIKQDVLVSGTNIKTVNGESVLGSGNLVIGGGFNSVQVFTSSGTWTKPSGIVKIKITATGGGAGGGDTTASLTAGGGGGGATVIDYYDVSNLTSLNITIGAGGTSTIGSDGGGGAGGDTSIIGTGINVRAKGGSSWTGSTSGGFGGSNLLSSGSPAAIKIKGGDGANGNTTGIGGNGGSSFFSGMSAGGSNHTTSHGVAPGYGGGAGGGTNSYNPAVTGGNGIVIIEEYK